MLYLDPPNGKGPVTQALGTLGAQLVYGVLYLGLGATLAYSKIKKRSKMRKNALLGIYLTGFFTFLLSIGLNGWSIKLLDNVAITVASFGCWLYWTFKTEYITNEEFVNGYEDEH